MLSECRCLLEARLDAVAGQCLAEGWRFTGLRREVLGLVFEAGGSVGAYGLLDRLRLSRARAAPPTVYRALSFLRKG
jgi:Fur family zinc uptake transcriptional regulator